MSEKTLIRVKRAFIDGEIESILGIEIEDHLISKVTNTTVSKGVCGMIGV